MSGTPQAPDPEALARWLLASEQEMHTDSEELTMAAVQVYEHLRAHLAIFLGLQGFDALWNRALHMVRRSFPSYTSDALSPPGSSAHQLDVAVRGRDPAEAHAVLLAIFTQLLTLLFTFIGADLGFRLLHQHWPALPAPTATLHGEEAQQ